MFLSRIECVAYAVSLNCILSVFLFFFFVQPAEVIEATLVDFGCVVALATSCLAPAEVVEATLVVFSGM